MDIRDRTSKCYALFESFKQTNHKRFFKTEKFEYSLGIKCYQRIVNLLGMVMALWLGKKCLCF